GADGGEEAVLAERRVVVGLAARLEELGQALHIVRPLHLLDDHGLAHERNLPGRAPGHGDTSTLRARGRERKTSSPSTSVTSPSCPSATGPSTFSDTSSTSRRTITPDDSRRRARSATTIDQRGRSPLQRTTRNSRSPVWSDSRPRGETVP